MTPNPSSIPTRHHWRWRALPAAAGAVAVLVSLAACQNEPNPAPSASLSTTVAPGTFGDDLYQAHCAACHGRQGRGDGIARTFLGVVPRDFRNESFRYVSTLDGTATHEDLAQTIRLGRLAGQMPAAPWLTDEEVDELAGYVRELNRLGWVDRLAVEFESEGLSVREIAEIATERVTPEEIITVGYPGPGFRPDTERGRDLYMQSCASCHGPEGRGDGLDMPLDELGRPIEVRDLTGALIQGGDSPIELYKRIRCGVPGTPMPAQEALTDEQVWQLVFYTRHLAGRPLAR
ncbi:MAG: c-type cytochrome [Planctomycetota bacterium]|jgi:mono/diheme cytochrome c family protein